MTMTKVLWDSEVNLENWEDVLREEYPEAITESEKYDIATMLNNQILEDERANLNILVKTKMLVIGELGLWNGEFNAYKEIASGKIGDCLFSDCDSSKWELDANNDLVCIGKHHDGTNRYIYRAYKEDASEEEIQELKDSIFYMEDYTAALERLTEPLGPYIQEAYGWYDEEEKAVSVPDSGAESHNTIIYDIYHGEATKSEIIKEVLEDYELDDNLDNINCEFKFCKDYLNGEEDAKRCLDSFDLHEKGLSMIAVHYFDNERLLSLVKTQYSM